MATLALDVYGTLIDTHGIVAMLEQWLGSQAAEFSRRWRDKQLEYSFRRGLMRQYQPFSECTRQALEYTDEVTGSNLSREHKLSLMQAYGQLPAFTDVSPALRDLRAAGHRLFAFSNGQADAVNGLLDQAGVLPLLDDIVSVDALQTFKPSPSVYQHLLAVTGSEAAHTWLVSGNAFDVIGAVASGLRAAWIRRDSNSVFDPWEYQPTETLSSLKDLTPILQAEVTKK